MKKIILMCIVVLCVFALAACATTTTLNTGSESDIVTAGTFKTYDLQTINYAFSSADQDIDADEVSLSLYPVTEYSVGDTVTVSAKLNTVLSGSNPYLYFIVDWGDGTWSYGGPYINSAAKRSTGSLSHQYGAPGTYAIKAAAVELSTGKLYGWTESQNYTIVGSGSNTADIIKRVMPIASSASAGYEIKNIVDNASETVFKTGEASDSTEEEWIGLLFEDAYELSRLEIQLPEAEETFPSNIAIEYTTDGGKIWQSLPKYYYLFDYSIGQYSPIMRFPNPKGATLSLMMDGIVCNGIRITSKLFLTEPRTLAISEIRAYGTTDQLLYTSIGGTFDADLNNMWTIFGTAKTEPVVYGSVAGESTNQSPFRTGSAMIASTEWAEWTGLKFNWTGYDAVQDAYLNQLINIRTGSDGWSNDDGYVYATADSAQHLGMQNHYTYNQIFILAVRNYLLTGNNVEIYQNGEYVHFLDAKNRYGQTIAGNLEKAMSYMLETLDGKSGILTINDPRNDGTVTGVASNYWDVHRSFGFKSAYENSLFYGSLLAMADIKTYLGKPEEAQYYTDLATLAKVEFNKLFWDEGTGRYITSVNAQGVRLDYGMTYVNFYACAYGVATAERAALIYDWIDGDRIISSDTSTGKDIYGAFVYAARSNTLDISSTGAPYYWFDHNGALPCTEGTFGGFGHQMQNGGTIFYISYYDMLGRINQVSANDGYQRFQSIMTEFHVDSLRRNQYMAFVQDGYQGYGEYVEGVIGEFPESGLVPLTFITGFLGLNVKGEGLVIDPNLPTAMKYAGIRSYQFGNRTYSIQVSTLVEEASVQIADGKYFITVPADETYVLTLDNRLIKK